VEVTSSQRKAQLKVANADKQQNAEVIFFHFRQGGGFDVKSNDDR